MKRLLLAATLATAAAAAVGAGAVGSAGLPTPDTMPEKPRAEPGERGPSLTPGDSTSGSGMVIEPPVTDPEALKKPPENVDPEIDRATDDIDEKNREEMELKDKPQQR